MNGSTLAIGFAAGLAAFAAARLEGRGYAGSRANDSDRLDPVRSDLTRIHLKSPSGAPGERGESREAVETRFFDALESVAGKGQVLYVGPFVMVGDKKGGVYGNLEIGVSAMENGSWGVHLGFIGVPREARRTGRGSKLLSIVTAAADAAGLPMDLDVDPTTMRGDAKAPVSKKDLRAWYGRFGFKSVKSLGIDYMARPAKTPAARGSSARRPADPHLYHATPYRSLLGPGGIAAVGLRPGRSPTHFTVGPGLSTWFTYVVPSEGGDTEVPVALRVLRAQLQKLVPDREGTKDAGAAAFTTVIPVPPDDIEIWTGSRWVPVTDHVEVDRSDFWAEIEDGMDPTDSALLPEVS